MAKSLSDLYHPLFANRTVSNSHDVGNFLVAALPWTRLIAVISLEN